MAREPRKRVTPHAGPPGWGDVVSIDPRAPPMLVVDLERTPNGRLIVHCEWVARDGRRILCARFQGSALTVLRRRAHAHWG